MLGRKLDVKTVLNWSAGVLGRIENVSDHTRSHPGDRTITTRVQGSSGEFFIKIHRFEANWEQEVHAYENWSAVFGRYAPRLLGVRADPPWALITSALAGQPMASAQLTGDQEKVTWRDAGTALRGLHQLAGGDFFGACHRDGSASGDPIDDAAMYFAKNIRGLVESGSQAGTLSTTELEFIELVSMLIPACKGEAPVPCHRDFGPANWMIAADGSWAGVLDFELAHWDVRTMDFSRYPDWEWIHRPDLIAAFFEGYEFSPTPEDERQLLVSRALYALDAIVWGSANDYHGFVREGREALQYLAGQLG